tara:strand:- start:528 stop:1460 length:933 start_codon:yes stop_codon:yes gene_type:complete
MAMPMAMQQMAREQAITARNEKRNYQGGLTASSRAHDMKKLVENRVYQEAKFNRQQKEKQRLGTFNFNRANSENDRRFGRVKSPAQQAQAMALAANKRPPTLETAYDKRSGENLADIEKSVQDTGQAAVNTNSYLNMAKTFVIGENTASEFGAMVGKMAQGLGVPLPEGFEKRVTNATSFEAMMGNILAQKLAQQKGPQTDRDANRMKDTLATLRNTVEARVFLIDAAKAMNQRDIDKAAFYRDFKTESGSTIGANRAWNDKIKDMPLFGNNKTTKMPVFFEGFMKNNMAANPDLTREQVVAEWKKRYGG